MKLKQNTYSQGFSAIETLCALAVVITLSLGGWYVWYHSREPKVTSRGSSSASSNSQKESTPVADPYAGWKTYCDTTYHYCFKYPSTWKLTVEMMAQKPGEVGQVHVTSPDGSVLASYINANDRSTDVNLTPLSVTKGDADPFSVVGGYIAYGTGYLPLYHLADKALLDAYPISISKSSNFPSSSSFTDAHNEGIGSFVAQPQQPSSTTAEARNWFATPDANESLRILASLQVDTTNN